MDVLNQIPNYLIRGENWRAIGSLLDAYRRFRSIEEAPEQRALQWDRYRRLDFHDVKAAYEAQAPDNKMIWFNEFGLDRVMLATRAFYSVLFGHFGPGVVSGFKEIRYVCGHYFRSEECETDFNDWMAFLVDLCLDVKVIFNSRTLSTIEANPGLAEMDERVALDCGRQFVRDLTLTHHLYDEYARLNPDRALRMHREEMFDPQRNATLVRRLLDFLGERRVDPESLSFARMPAWTSS